MSVCGVRGMVVIGMCCLPCLQWVSRSELWWHSRVSYVLSSVSGVCDVRVRKLCCV